MRVPKDPPSVEHVPTKLTEEILRRRRLVQARLAKRWRRLVLTGAVSTTALTGAAGCETSQVCLSYIPTLQCPANTDDWILMEKAYPTATWMLDGDRWLVAVDVTTNLLPEDDPLSFTAGPTLEGATLVTETVTDDHVVFTCEPAPGEAEVLVSIPVDCADHAQALRFAVDVNRDPMAGSSLQIHQLTD